MVIPEAEIAVKEWVASKYNSQYQHDEAVKLLEEFNLFLSKTKNLQNGSVLPSLKHKQVNGIDKEVKQ